MDLAMIRRAFGLAAAVLFCAVAFVAPARSQTWDGSSGNYNDPGNWSPTGVPTNTDTAIFGTLGQTALSFQSSAQVGGWTFNSGASNYTFNASQFGLSFEGSGIGINGGSATINVSSSGYVAFHNSSTAGNAIINNNSFTYFYDSSTAGYAVITVTGNSQLAFLGSSTAGNAAITNNGGSNTVFTGSSTAGNAVITNNSGGFTYFTDNSTAGSAALMTNSGGTTDFSLSTGPNGDNKLGAGSIAGAGSYYLGSNELTVGGNNLSTTVSGVISDCGAGGSACGNSGATGGSLVKVGQRHADADGRQHLYRRDDGQRRHAGGRRLDRQFDTSRSMPAARCRAPASSANTSIKRRHAGAGQRRQSLGTLTVTGPLAFAAGVELHGRCLAVGEQRPRQRHGHGDARRRHGECESIASGSYVAKQYTILTRPAASAARSARWSTPTCRRTSTTSLSYDANDAYLNLALSFVRRRQRPQRQPAGGRQRADQFLQHAPAAFRCVFGALTPQGLTQASGETATGSQQTTFDAMNQFMGLMTDPFIAGRGDRRSAGARRLCRRGRRAYAAQAQRRRDALSAMFTKAPPAEPFEQRWSVWAAGFGGSQTTDGNAALGSNNTTSSIYGTAVGADYLLLAEHARRLCAGRRRHQFQRRQRRHRPLRPVPGRRLHPPHCRRRPMSPARWPMAGRTSPPTAP